MTDANDSHSSAADEPTAEQRADDAADLKAVLGVFALLVAIAVVFISGWSPQF